MIEQLARTYLPPAAARLAKRAAVYPRYWRQRRACRAGYRQYGERYSQHVLFVAGLPKSGTTWLERMLTGYAGFHTLLIPDVAAYELRTGGSHDYELPDDIFGRWREMLVVSKMHVHGSAHNAALLRRAGVRYVVLYRDLRDVAVSHYFYVRQTPWHPEFPLYSRLTLPEALIAFANRTAAAFSAWVRSWDENRDPDLSLMMRYEDLLADTAGTVARIAQHFSLDDSPATVQRLVAQHSFRRLSGGRSPGEDDAHSFFRKGVSGDWCNHFSTTTKAIYKEVVGDFLIRYGYERNSAW